MAKLLECLRCGYTWKGRREEPKACPMCKSYRWKLANTYTEEQVEKT